MNIMDYFLDRQGRHLSIILATTGDTGPAAAFAAAGKPTIDCWPLFPSGMISKEQRLQMTTLDALNIHPVAAAGCLNGGDDIDLVVASLFSKPELKKELNLSSVNSINWCRVMVQAAHYAYGYSRVCGTPDEAVDICVPSGAFGNLFAGFLARKMGVPIRRFICANNANQTLHTVFSTGVFKAGDLKTTVSSAIDIVIPYNFWRFLYFCCGCDGLRLARYMDTFEQNGEIRLDPADWATARNGFESMAVTDDQTLDTIRRFWAEKQYLLDPHSAVAVHAAQTMQDQDDSPVKTVCLATAHPAKFPDVIRTALGPDLSLPEPAMHPSIKATENLAENVETCEIGELESFLISDIGQVVKKGRANG